MAILLFFVISTTVLLMSLTYLFLTYRYHWQQAKLKSLKQKEDGDKKEV